MTNQTSISNHQQRAAKAASSMADRNTPLIRNNWYVAARGEEIGRKLTARMYLGISTVLFRKEDGSVVAMQNRCCHRSFPLSESKLDGDIVQCGYHGLRYDCSGKCVSIPAQKKTPENIRLRTFPVVERGPFIWIWPGDPKLADPALLPAQEFIDDPEWSFTIGFLKIKASYVHLFENLLDLTHLSFVHDKTFGTPEYARAPMDVAIDNGYVEVWRNVECILPPMFAKPLGWEGDTAKRTSGGKFVSPALNVNQAILENISAPQKNSGIQPRVYVESLVTPETKDLTCYYYAIYRNFGLNDEKVEKFLLESTTSAFSEDVVVLELIQNMLDSDETNDFYEMNIASDKPGVAMRRHLKRLADLEEAVE